MGRGKVRHSWAEEVQLWELMFIKKEPAKFIQSGYQFSADGKLETVIWTDEMTQNTSVSWITDYRLRESKNRFLALSYAEWGLLPVLLQTEHPNRIEYSEDRKYLVPPQERPTTPIQWEAWEQCQNEDHSWMASYTKFEGVAFEGAAWIEGDTIIEAKRCYFCHKQVVSKDPGGVPYYGGVVRGKPDWVEMEPRYR